MSNLFRRFKALIPDAPLLVGTVVATTPLRIELPDGSAIAFEVEAFARECMLKGVDQMGYLLMHADAIDAFEKSRAA